MCHVVGFLILPVTQEVEGSSPFSVASQKAPPRQGLRGFSLYPRGLDDFFETLEHHRPVLLELLARLIVDRVTILILLDERYERVVTALIQRDRHEVVVFWRVGFP